MLKTLAQPLNERRGDGPIDDAVIALPLRAAPARRAISAAQAHRSSCCASRSTGTIRPASVCVATPACTALYCVSTPASSSKREFTCGCSGTPSTMARIRNGSSVRCARPVPAFAFSAVRSASSSVTSTSSTYVKYGMRCFDSCMRAAGQVSVEIGLHDPPCRATERHVIQVDAECPGACAHCG